jgi:superfamily I DNA/RNA helicase
MIDVRLTSIDGPPGVGKTTTIIRDSATFPENSCIITYTNSAADELKKRAPQLSAGTVYSVSWPFVKQYSKGATKKFKAQANWATRPVHHLLDPALVNYELSAPSRQAKRIEDELSTRIHAWVEGPPPIPLAKLEPKGGLRFLLPLARWVEAGCPANGQRKFDLLIIDEAQDMSALEMRAALGMLAPNGKAYAYGDPGQAIFARAKGLQGSALPPAWELARDGQILKGGWRVGEPCASLAAAALRSYYDRPATTFAAEHKTEVLTWEPRQRPLRGLVLGYSRAIVAKYFRKWGLTQSAVVPAVGRAERELIICTGHAAKGAEADEVYLLPWSKPGTLKLDHRDPEAVRLLYVMVTRAKKRLYLPRALRARINS